MDAGDGDADGDFPDFTETPLRRLEPSYRGRKRAHEEIDAQMQTLLGSVQEQVDSWKAKRFRHEHFALYLANQLEQLPAQVARSLEFEFLAKVNSVIDEYETIQTQNDVTE